MQLGLGLVAILAVFSAFNDMMDVITKISVETDAQARWLNWLGENNGYSLIVIMGSLISVFFILSIVYVLHIDEKIKQKLSGRRKS